jgi:hypothetical protein
MAVSGKHFPSVPCPKLGFKAVARQPRVIRDAFWQE